MRARRCGLEVSSCLSAVVTATFCDTPVPCRCACHCQSRRLLWRKRCSAVNEGDLLGGHPRYPNQGYDGSLDDAFLSVLFPTRNETNWSMRVLCGTATVGKTSIDGHWPGRRNDGRCRGPWRRVDGCVEPFGSSKFTPAQVPFFFFLSFLLCLVLHSSLILTAAQTSIHFLMQPCSIPSVLGLNDCRKVVIAWSQIAGSRD